MMSAPSSKVDDAEDVVGFEQVHHIGAGAFGVLQRLAFHGPGAVQRQGDVQRQARAAPAAPRADLKENMLARLAACRPKHIPRHGIERERARRKTRLSGQTCPIGVGHLGAIRVGHLGPVGVNDGEACPVGIGGGRACAHRPGAVQLVAAQACFCPGRPCLALL